MANPHRRFSMLHNQHYIAQTFVPFNSEAEANFTDMHVPDNNIRGYELREAVVTKQLSQTDIAARSLNIGQVDNETMGFENDGRTLKAWEPYSRRWWTFSVSTRSGNKKHLGGWPAYRAAHNLERYDTVTFNKARRPDGVEFIVITHVRHSPAVRNRQAPFTGM